MRIKCTFPHIFDSVISLQELGNKIFLSSFIHFCERLLNFTVETFIEKERIVLVPMLKCGSLMLMLKCKMLIRGSTNSGPMHFRNWRGKLKKKLFNFHAQKNCSFLFSNCL